MGIKEEPLSSVVKEVAKIGKKFTTSVESFYDPKAIADGCITGKDRDGTVRTFPLMSVSAAVLSLPIVNDRLQTPEDIGNIMAGLKKGAKQAPLHEMRMERGRMGKIFRAHSLANTVSMFLCL